MPKAGLLVAEHLEDLAAAIVEFRVLGPELVDHDFGDVGQERLLDPQQPAVPDRLAQDAAQHVGAALVARQHAVADQEDRAAQVVGHDPQRAIGLGIDVVRHASQRGNPLDQRLVVIGVVHRASALDEQDQALQAHAGIHARLRERRGSALGRGVVLHEHVVPELEEARSVGAGRGVVLVDAPLLAAIEVDLGVRAVRSDRPRRPPVVVELVDALFGHADLVAPDQVGLFILRVDGGVEALGGETHPFGQELPRPGKRLVP